MASKMTPMDIETSATASAKNKSHLRQRSAARAALSKFSLKKAVVACRRHFRSQTNTLTFIGLVGCMIIFVVHLLPFFTYDVRLQSNRPPSVSAPPIVDHKKTPVSDYYYTKKQSDFDMDVDFDVFRDDWVMNDDYYLYTYLEDDEYISEYAENFGSFESDQYDLPIEMGTGEGSVESNHMSTPGSTTASASGTNNINILDENETTMSGHENDAIGGVEDYKKYV
jgi:hypothetical protein